MKCKYIYLQTLQIICENVFATCYENNNKYLENGKDICAMYLPRISASLDKM